MALLQHEDVQESAIGQPTPAPPHCRFLLPAAVCRKLLPDFLFVGKLADDSFRKELVDFLVTGDGLREPCVRMLVDVVLLSSPNQDTALLLQGFD